MRRPKRKGIAIVRFLIVLLIVAFLLLCCVLFLMSHKMSKVGSRNDSLSKDIVKVANERRTGLESQITSQEKRAHTISSVRGKEDEGEGVHLAPSLPVHHDSHSVDRPLWRPHFPPKHRAHALRQAEMPSGDSINDSVALPTKILTPVKAAHTPNLESVLLIICANRPDYLKKTLKYVNLYHPRTTFAVVVSEDGVSETVRQVVDETRLEFTANGDTATATVVVPFLHIHHPSSRIGDGVSERAGFNANGYFKLSAHYKWALSQVFGTGMVQSKTRENVQNGPSLRQFSASAASSSGRPAAASLVHFASEVKRVVILEEDLQIAPDFFSYFSALSHMIDTDESLLAVSAWNDNGQAAFVKNPEQLYRSDFSPGLGWMMSRRIWEELGPKWPRAYWDDWLREPPQRKDRHIIRPEICRTFHFGVRGVSNSQFSKFLEDIKLNSDPVDFSSLDLSYLEKGNWEEEYVDQVRRADLITMDMFNVVKESSTEITIQYTSLDDPTDPTSFVRLAQWAGIMDNVKAKVPRTAYHGIVSIWKDGVKLHLQSADM